MNLAARCTTELTGTFVLVLSGTGAMVAEVVFGTVGPVGVALCFGLAVTAVIYAVGDISGAHINPAVSFAFWLAGRLPGREAAAFAVSQCAGAVLASSFLLLLVPLDTDVGATRLAVASVAGLALETAITFILVFVILNVTLRGDPGGIGPIAIGATVTFCALFAGPLTGASMNPARTLGPAIATGSFDDLWVYLAGPALGAALAVAWCRGVRPDAFGAADNGNETPSQE